VAGVARLERTGLLLTAGADKTGFLGSDKLTGLRGENQEK
jgi:hypothetical protein